MLTSCLLMIGSKWETCREHTKTVSKRQAKLGREKQHVIAGDAMAKLISNEFRTCSMSIPAVEMEANGGQCCLGERSHVIAGDNDDYHIVLKPTGYDVGGYGQDPLDVLLAEEELLFIETWGSEMEY